MAAANPSSSIVFFLVLTLVYFVFKYYTKSESTLKMWTIIYFLVLIVVQFFINLGLTGEICGSSQYGMALRTTLLPWLMVFGTINLLLFIFIYADDFSILKDKFSNTSETLESALDFNTISISISLFFLTFHGLHFIKKGELTSLVCIYFIIHMQKASGGNWITLLPLYFLFFLCSLNGTSNWQQKK